MKNFFLYGITHVIKQKSSDNYAEKVTLQISLSFPCNLMDNFERNFLRHFTESAQISPMASTGYFI
jgi:hypothetical protein